MGGPSKSKKQDGVSGFLQRLPLICGAAAISESITFPIDFTKTRMQFAKGDVGIFKTISLVVKDEGALAFYQGLSPAIARHWVYTAARIYLYEHMRDTFSPADGSQPGFVTKFAIGATAGGIGQFIASPADMVKVRMVTDKWKNKPPIYKNAADCIRKLHAEGGALGFWRGVGPNVSRAMAVNLGELATYDLSKQWVLKTTGLNDGPQAHSMAAVMSGFVSSLCSCPFDVLKTRMMAGTHKSSLACIKDTFVNEGFLAFYKGFFPCWARLGPWQFFFWVSYEKLRNVVGIKGF